MLKSLSGINSFFKIFFLISIPCFLISCGGGDYKTYNKAKALYEAQQYNEALKTLQKLEKKYPESPFTDFAKIYKKQIENSLKLKTGNFTSVQPKSKTKKSSSKIASSKKPEKLLSNIYYDTDIREIIRNLSAETGVNIIMDDTVQGVISVKYKNKTLDEVLKLILTPGGFTYKKMDGYYLVGSPDPRSPLFIYLSETKYYKPRFLKAEDLVKLLPSAFTSYIQIDKKRNLLTITASPEIIKRIINDIKKIDKPPKQVLIEALVAEVSSEALKDLGIDWSGQSRKFSAGVQNLGISFTYISTPYLTRTLTAKLKLLAEKGLATIKATPRVVTMDGEEAKIDISLEQYISTVTGPITYPYVNLQNIKAGVILNIVPLISDNNTITLKIQPAEVSDFILEKNEVGGDLPKISKRSVNTTVVVKDGETLIIGGLTKKRTREVLRKIPILGDIPLLNLFFSKWEKRKEDTEIIILITPKILPEIY